MDQALFIIGVSHETAPVAIRERLAYAESELIGALARLKVQAPSVSEAALLSTCNRVELIGVGSDIESAARETVEFLRADRGTDLSMLVPALYRLDERAAVRHLFRVGASLDSMVLGEPQILGQLKLAYAHAAQAGTAGLVLHRAFHKAFLVAKRVRKTTSIGHGQVSISSAVVKLAEKIVRNLHDKTVMIVGSGKIAETTARSLDRIQPGKLLITSRTFNNAIKLANEVGGSAVPFEHWIDHLKTADVIIGSLSVTMPVLGPKEVYTALSDRQYRPLCLIDLGVPRNFDEQLKSLEGVYLYDIDDLGRLVAQSREHREREAQRAGYVLETELDSFMKWLDGLALVPVIKDICSSLEQVRYAELERHRAWLARLGAEDAARTESLTRCIVNKLLHRVICGLRQSCEGAFDSTYATEIARNLLCSDLYDERPRNQLPG
jgi:glutamyl-tRNA reductase